MYTVGGVAQWLGRRSLAVGLFLIYVGKVWVNQQGQLNLPSLWGR